MASISQTQVLKTINIELPYDPAIIPLIGTQLKELKAGT